MITRNKLLDPRSESLIAALVRGEFQESAVAKSSTQALDKCVPSVAKPHEEKELKWFEFLRY